MLINPVALRCLKGDSCLMTKEELQTRLLGALTEKQCQVLDLLLEHKTSKEISRILGISPHTVDQRINFARAKLGCQNRGELANRYRAARSICEGSVYQESYVPPAAFLLNESDPDEPERMLIEKHSVWTEEDEKPSTESEYWAVPGIFEGRSGVWMRALTIAAMAAFLLLVLAGGLFAFQKMSDILEG